MRRRKPVVRNPLPSAKQLKKIKALKEAGRLKQTVATAKQEVKEVVAKVKEEVQETVEDVKEIAKETVSEIKEVLQDAKEELQEEVKESVEEVKEEVEQSLEDLSKDELIEKAKELGLSVRKNWGKSTIISKIQDAE